MPTFPAPQPLTVTVDQLAGALHVVAGDRDDVVVTVLPTTPGRAADVRTAQETTVDLTQGVLSVRGPRSFRHQVLGPRGSVEVTVELPTGSSLSGRLAAGSLRTEGFLAAVVLTLGAGDARLDDAGRVDLRVSAGSVVVGRVSGTVEIRTSAGSVRMGELAGQGQVRSSAGGITIGEVRGSLELAAGHGDVAVDVVRGTLTSRSSSGGIRVDAVASGSVDLSTSYGSVEVGVPEGTVAHLDVSSRHGAVRSLLEPGDGPSGGQDVAEVRVSTGYGDVVVRRPEAAATAGSARTGR